jgi:RNA polymerase sigma factor (sigma-70 family)
MATNLSKVVQHLHHLLSPPGGDRTDGELLARFVATRDEASFAALMRRHGPMVLAVCRRLLGHVQDAEDCFQATFMVLARKAATVKRESVSSWLYAVAYRTSLEARTINARRRMREKQVPNMPHPEVTPPESQDWRHWLDQELNRLPQKYREVIVACDLEGRSRKEAAHLLGIAEGTLSSRLARGRRLLAQRLAPYGLSLSGAALASALCESAASAPVPAALFSSTTKAALLVAAGEFAALSASSAILMKGVLKSMFLTKLKLMIGAVMVVMALGASGLIYRAEGQSAAPPAARWMVAENEGKSASELERLRHEVELLKLNLRVVLEKMHAQEAELRTLKAKPAQAAFTGDARILATTQEGKLHVWDADSGKALKMLTGKLDVSPRWATVEKDKLDASSKSRDEGELNDAVNALETTLKTLREHVKGEEVQKIEKALKERLDQLQKELAERVKIRQNIMQMQSTNQAIQEAIKILQQQNKTGSGQKK